MRQARCGKEGEVGGGGSGGGKGGEVGGGRGGERFRTCFAPFIFMFDLGIKTKCKLILTVK